MDFTEIRGAYRCGQAAGADSASNSAYCNSRLYDKFSLGVQPTAIAEPRQLYEPCACCGGHDITAQADGIGDYMNVVARLAHLIYAGNEHHNDAELLNRTATEIIGGVYEGYGNGVPTIAYNTPNYRMLRHLEQNVYSFSAAKNYHQLKDMTLALMDGDRLRTESEFLAEVRKMNLKYNHDWLVTERHTAVASGQMASHWVEFESNKDEMPMLQYSTVGDGKVRDTHKALDGIIKPVDDPFWNTYYPPNGWNCRCDVIQLPGRNITPTKDNGVPQVITPLFETNLAKQGLIFPKGHPYFNGVPKPELRKAMAYLPPENSYKAVKGINGKMIDVHLMHNNSEVMQNLTVADNLIALGYKDIRLLPDLHEKEANLKIKFYPKEYKPLNIKKNPDAWIKSKSGKNMVCDFKVLTGERNLATRIAYAEHQADYAIIKLNFNHSGQAHITSNAKRAFKTTQSLKGLIVLDRKGALIYEQYR